MVVVVVVCGRSSGCVGVGDDVDIDLMVVKYGRLLTIVFIYLSVCLVHRHHIQFSRGNNLTLKG
jgi:hypothetical protein